MGLIAKQKTKARTAAAQHSTNLSMDWGGRGMPHMAAIVRTAACAVAQRKNLRSSGFRGHDTLGIGSSMRSGASTIWVEQAGFDDWVIALGLETIKGWALDWGLMCHTSRTSEVSVNITTPAVLTKDGAQVHKDEYLEVRELVITGLTASAPPPPSVEIAAVQQGLSVHSVPFVSDSTTPYGESYVISTGLDADHVYACLARLHFPRIADGGSGGRWLIGLSTARERSWIALAVRDLGQSRELAFTVHLERDESMLTNAVATLHARAFGVCALRLIHAQDEHAAISGTGSPTDAIS